MLEEKTKQKKSEEKYKIKITVKNKIQELWKKTAMYIIIIALFIDIARKVFSVTNCSNISLNDY